MVGGGPKIGWRARGECRMAGMGRAGCPLVDWVQIVEGMDDENSPNKREYHLESKDGIAFTVIRYTHLHIMQRPSTP